MVMCAQWVSLLAFDSSPKDWWQPTERSSGAVMKSMMSL